MIRIRLLLILSLHLLVFNSNDLKADPKVNIDPSKTAVLIMDYQNVILSGGYVENQEEFLGKAAKVLNQARKAKLQVIYIVVGFRPGFPEISPNNRMFNAIRKSGGLNSSDPKAWDIHASVLPQSEDIVIIKHRVGAFLGTDLDMILRAKGIDTLVLFGVATSGVVLSTLRYASDADYRNIVIKDLCSDKDSQIHDTLVEKVFPRQADIISSEEFLQSFVIPSK